MGPSPLVKPAFKVSRKLVHEKKKLNECRINIYGAASSGTCTSTLDSDMLFVANALRLTEKSRVALAEYDAATLEDFSLMTDIELKSLFLTEARHGKPFPPLQQRKIKVLLHWVHQQLDEQIKKEKEHQKLGQQEQQKQKQNDDDDDAAADATHSTLASSIEEDHDDDNNNSKKFDKELLISANWKEKFKQDLPMLIQKLVDERTKASNSYGSSIVSEGLLDFRWLFCGLQR